MFHRSLYRFTLIFFNYPIMYQSKYYIKRVFSQNLLNVSKIN